MADHKWYLCSMCGPTILCGTCGNNACNAGKGKLPDGSDCPDCEASWKVQDEFRNSDIGKIYMAYIHKLFDESNQNRRYWDHLEFYLGQHHFKILKEAWEAIDAEDGTLRPEGSLSNEEFFKNHKTSMAHVNTTESVDFSGL